MAFLGVFIVVFGAFLSYFFIFDRDLRIVYPDKIAPNLYSDSEYVRWEFDGREWMAHGDPPDCFEPFVLSSPVDLGQVSGVLYPGQLRGNDYKPHGGFRFDNKSENSVTVRAVMDGYLLKASKYNDRYDTQIQIFYVHPCGIMVMHDHLLTLSSRLEEALESISVGENGDSRTTNIDERVYIEKGEVLATEVGYPYFPGGHNDMNVFVDFGLYDLRAKNDVVYDDAFRQNNPNVGEYGAYGLCFIDYLENADLVRRLPVGGSEGKMSDYCVE